MRPGIAAPPPPVLRVKRDLRSDREGRPARSLRTAQRLRSFRRAEHAARRTHGRAPHRYRSAEERARIPILSRYTAGRELDCAEERGRSSDDDRADITGRSTPAPDTPTVRLGAADQDSDREHECAADDDLENGGDDRRVQVMVPDPRDDGELHRHDADRECGRRAGVADKERQRVPQPPPARSWRRRWHRTGPGCRGR